MMTDNFEDTRESPRIAFNITVHVETQSSLQEFYSRNLSKGGIFLEVPGEAPEIGSLLSLIFQIPNLQRPLRVQGEVIYRHAYETLDEDSGDNIGRQGIGLRFMNLSLADEQVISEYIAGRDICVSTGQGE